MTSFTTTGTAILNRCVNACMQQQQHNIALVCQSAHRKHLLQWCMQPLHGLTHPGRCHVTMLSMYREITSKSARRQCWHRIYTLTFGVTLLKSY